MRLPETPFRYRSLFERLEGPNHTHDEERLSSQLESQHFFRHGDTVIALDGAVGRIVEEWALYAIVEWSGGEREELEQFDPRVSVIQRAA